MKQTGLPTKIFSTFLCCTLFISNCVGANAFESNIWSDRKKSAQIIQPDTLQFGNSKGSKVQLLPVQRAFSLNFVGLIQTNEPNPELNKDNQPNLNEFGTIRRVLLPNSRSKPTKTVFHIQDIHLNAEAQKNISGILRTLLEKEKIDCLALEGSFSPIDLSGFHKFPYQEVITKATRYLQRTNKISGGLYTALTAGQRIPLVLGVDDEKHYHSNVKAYKNAAFLQPLVTRNLKTEDEILIERKIKEFNPGLLNFDEKIRAYRENRVSLRDHVILLTSDLDSSVKNHQLLQFNRALQLESTINFARAEIERTQILTRLSSHLNERERKKLLALCLSFSKGNTPPPDFYQQLKELFFTHKLLLSDYPELDKYIQYVSCSFSLNPEEILNEVKTAEETTYAKLAKTPQEMSLVAQSRNLFLKTKLTNFSLTRDEWEEYKTATLGSKSSPFIDFYREAEYRDAAMAQNLLRQLESNKEKGATFLITGGFHSRGIDERLASAGYRVVSITPKITKVDSQNSSSYLNSFAQEKTPLEILFQGEHLFLSPLIDNDLKKTILPILAFSAKIHPDSKITRLLHKLLPKLPTDFSGGAISFRNWVTTFIRFENRISVSFIKFNDTNDIESEIELKPRTAPFPLSILYHYKNFKRVKNPERFIRQGYMLEAIPLLVVIVGASTLGLNKVNLFLLGNYNVSLIGLIVVVITSTLAAIEICFAYQTKGGNALNKRALISSNVLIRVPYILAAQTPNAITVSAAIILHVIFDEVQKWRLESRPYRGKKGSLKIERKEPSLNEVDFLRIVMDGIIRRTPRAPLNDVPYQLRPREDRILTLDKMTQRERSLYLRAKNNLIQVYQTMPKVILVLFPQWSEEQRNKYLKEITENLNVTGVFTETLLFINSPFSPLYRWGMQRVSRGRPILYVPMWSFANLKGNSDFEIAAFALIYGLAFKKKLKDLSRDKSKTEQEIYREIKDFDSKWDSKEKPFLTIGFRLKHLFRNLIDNWISQRLKIKIKIDTIQLESEGKEIKDQIKKTLTNNNENLLIKQEGNYSLNRELVLISLYRLREKVISLSERSVDLAYRQMMFGEQGKDMTLAEWTAILCIVDSALLPMQLYHDVLKVLIRTGNFDQVTEDLKKLIKRKIHFSLGKQGNKIRFELRLETEEQKLLWDYFSRNEFRKWINDDLTRQATIVSNDNERGKILSHRKSILGLLDQLEKIVVSNSPPHPPSSTMGMMLINPLTWIYMYLGKRLNPKSKWLDLVVMVGGSLEDSAFRYLIITRVFPFLFSILGLNPTAEQNIIIYALIFASLFHPVIFEKSISPQAGWLIPQRMALFLLSVGIGAGGQSLDLLGIKTIEWSPYILMGMMHAVYNLIARRNGWPIGMMGGSSAAHPKMKIPELSIYELEENSLHLFYSQKKRTPEQESLIAQYLKLRPFNTHQASPELPSEESLTLQERNQLEAIIERKMSIEMRQTRKTSHIEGTEEQLLIMKAIHVADIQEDLREFLKYFVVYLNMGYLHKLTRGDPDKMQDALLMMYRQVIPTFDYKLGIRLSTYIGRIYRNNHGSSFSPGMPVRLPTGPKRQATMIRDIEEQSERSLSDNEIAVIINTQVINHWVKGANNILPFGENEIHILASRFSKGDNSWDDLGMDPKNREKYRHLFVTEQRVNDIKNATRQQMSIHPKKGETATNWELKDQSAHSPISNTIKNETYGHLMWAIAQLTPRQKYITALHRGMNIDGLNPTRWALSLQIIAEIAGFTKEWARQEDAAIKEKLRDTMESPIPESPNPSPGATFIQSINGILNKQKPKNLEIGAALEPGFPHIFIIHVNNLEDGKIFKSLKDNKAIKEVDEFVIITKPEMTKNVWRYFREDLESIKYKKIIKSNDLNANASDGLYLYEDVLNHPQFAQFPRLKILRESKFTKGKINIFTSTPVPFTAKKNLANILEITLQRGFGWVTIKFEDILKAGKASRKGA